LTAIKHPQIPLVIPPREEFSFSNFVPGENSAVIAALKALSRPASVTNSFVYLWGNGGVGLSHLLQATCQYAAERQRATIYLPMRELLSFDPQVLVGIESMALVCIDDIDQIATSHAWQEAVFHLFNRMAQQQSALVVTGPAVPQHCGLSLADLVSRLASGIIYQVHEPSDIEKQELIRQRGRELGLELSAEVCRYLLNRVERSVPGLLKILQQLDREALSSRRNITIPFIRETMGW